MPEHNPKIRELEDRLDRLVATQIDFQKEISSIRRELSRLRSARPEATPDRTAQSFYVPPERPKPFTPAAEPSTPKAAGDRPRPVGEQPSYTVGQVPPRSTEYQNDPVLSSATVDSDPFSRFVSQYAESARANLEEFIGKNLISLIGIIVLVLGVGIGAKYAIDNNLISPLTRIIIGYVFGFGLVGLAFKLRRSYTNFSAVLISGGMAIMYFVTFFAYSSYALIPQLPAFGLMVMFTGATVAAALLYNRQVIAHIGLVGAYAVPFLLSSDSGNYLALFIYIALINTGILAVSLKKYWKPIFYTSSIFTWAIFCGWFFTKYSSQEHFSLALTFLAAFFAILYATKLAHVRLMKDAGDGDPTENLVSATVTVGVFYAMCLAIVGTGVLEAPQHWTFFTYVALASIALVAVSLSFYKNVYVLYASAFLSWLIFFKWFATTYSHQEYFELALVFLSVFFAISYATTLRQTRFTEHGEDLGKVNQIASIVSALIFFAFCFAIITDPLVELPRYWILFSYLAAASIIILATSLKFFGRVFMYVVVPCVWIIYGAWFIGRYDASLHFEIAAVFLPLLFAIFYSSIIFHRLVKDNFTLVEHTSLVLSNAFVFYGFGYSLLDSSEVLRDYLGLYTVANALLHLVIALAIRRANPNAVDVVQVLTILILTFASLAVPVQFDGNVVTMVWAVESSILFWYGRTRGVRLFERFSYPVMLLATGSLGLTWAIAYTDRDTVQPFLNSDFVTAAVYVAAFAFIYLTNRNRENAPAVDTDFVRPFGMITAACVCIVLYNMFRIEIGNYFYLVSVNAVGVGTGASNTPAGDLELFNAAWQINYTLFFLTAMAAVNIKKLRSTTLTLVNCGLGVIAIALFASISMFLCQMLREIFMSGQFNPDVVSHWMYIAIRPMSYALAAGLVYMLYQYSRDSLLEERIDRSALVYGFDALAYALVFIVASCELVNLMGQFRIGDATKLGLSILWGGYALVLIGIGIARDKKHLRIAAMALLGFTLAKLFLYDIADLDTIPKTILFVTLGITMLIVSFLYNKYKDVIFKADPLAGD